MRKRKRQVVKKLIQCAAVIAAGVLAIILFMLAIWYRGNLWKADFVGTEESAAAKTWFTAVPEKAAAMESV